MMSAEIMPQVTHAAVGCGHVTKDVDKIIFIGDLDEVDCVFCRTILTEYERKQRTSRAPKGENGNRLALCHPCSVGVHTACSAVYEDRWEDRCGCATCHPALMPENTVLDILYALAFAAYTQRGSDYPPYKDELFTAVRLQFTDAAIEQWVKTQQVYNAILAQGRKDYYSRDEVTQALVAAGLDMEWARTTPYTPKA